MRGGLKARLLAAAAAVLLGVAAIFAILFLAIRDLRDASSLAQQTQEVIAAANAAEATIFEVQSINRGYLVDGDERLLREWKEARARFHDQAAALERLEAEDADQIGLAQAITQAGRSYVDDWSVLLVETAGGDLEKGRALQRTGEGSRQIEALGAKFDEFITGERVAARLALAESRSAAARAVTLAAVGLAVFVVLMLFLGGYVRRLLVLPVQRLSRSARSLGGGDLSARVPPGGKGEMAELSAAFNGMAASIEERQLELDRFFNLALEMLCIADLNGHFRRLNPAFETTLGYSAEELLAKPFLDFVHPDDQEATLAEVEKLASGVDVIAFENRYRCKDGSYKWIAWNATALPDEGLIYAAARDVSERRLTEERISALNSQLQERAVELEQQNTELEHQTLELEAQQAELERVLGDLAVEKERVDAFYAFGQRLLAETDVDALAATILRELADFAEADVGALYAVTAEPGSDDGRAAPRLVATRGIEPTSIPAEVVSGVGPAGRALAELRPVKTSYGETGLRLVALGEEVVAAHELDVPLQVGAQLIGVVTLARVGSRPFAEDELAAIRHVTDRAALALANALVLEQARIQATIQRAVLDASRDGIRLVDREGRTLLANPAIEHLTTEVFGLPLDSTLEERSVIVGRLREPGAYLATMERIAADPECETLDEFELADTRRSFERFTGPVWDRSRALIGRIIVVRETTAQREADRLKSELVATVSHELRTPLSSILGFTELLLARELDGETRRRYLETISGEAKRLTALINDFLDLQRVEAGSFAPSLESLDLGEVIREQVNVFSAQSSAHELSLELPDAPLGVVGDRERLAQVVANLLSNAIKYSPDGGRVEVRGELAGDAARVAVRDEGLGIPAEQQEMLFTKFFRVDSTDTREIGGTGLGLALAREIVQAHHGHMGVESVEGEGSTFWFELPAARRGAGGSERILVVEDDPAAAALMVEYLGTNGFKVEVVSSGEDAVERVTNDPPALVSLDIGLAGELDGWQVLTSLKAHPETAHIPVIVCTAGDGHQQAATLGASDFLVKPFSGERLREIIARLLPRGGSVLVADDDESVRALVRESLANERLHVREAADGEEALALVRAERPDVLVLDLVMPRLDGFSVLEEIQDDPALRNLTVVVLTGKELSAAERDVLSLRAFSVLQKSSTSADELRRRVVAALARVSTQ